MSEQLTQLLDAPREFFKDGAFFLNRCTKPSRKGISSLRDVMLTIAAEFLEISRAVGVGFLIMGFIGFAVKLVHIPINNILVRGLSWKHSSNHRWQGIRMVVNSSSRRW